MKSQQESNMTEFGYRTTALEAVSGIDLTGKQVIVTGSYAGIGIETVRALASAGAKVTMACRDNVKAIKVASELNQSLGSSLIDSGALDLGSLASVRAFAESFRATHDKLDILINNGAVMACPQGLTSDGFEMQFGVNHLGHFCLTTELLPLLKAAQSARVICLSSTGHFISPVVFDDIQYENRPYDSWSSYGQAKTACSLLAVGIQNRFGDDGIEGFAVHPGGIMTTLQRHMSQDDIESRGWVDQQGNVNERFKTVEQGASTSVWAATSAELSGKGGCYLEDCAIADVAQARPEMPKGVMAYAVDPASADQLWQLSEKMIASKS
ncbi:MAG: NAD(P)-dependent dehydrogenase (short-subunit alcohol dehydrogenase family) [Patiriisocius sp.]|jgi:NAD(P)-dependent dehydrogenase (short-subunit alcohol dehydrogenase family)